MPKHLYLLRSLSVGFSLGPQASRVQLTDWRDQVSSGWRVRDGDVHGDEHEEEGHEEADPVVAAVQRHREGRKRREREEGHWDVVRD